MRRAKSKGFTLIELMITVAIVAILSAVAYPAYTNSIVRGKRSAAAAFVMSVANRQEQSMVNARAYFSAANNAAWAANKISLPQDVSDNYDVTMTSDSTATPPVYAITAVPRGTQATKDAKCGSLTYNQLGTKGVSGVSPIADCWK